MLCLVHKVCLGFLFFTLLFGHTVHFTDLSSLIVVEPMAQQWKQSPNHWIDREFLILGISRDHYY